MAVRVTGRFEDKVSTGVIHLVKGDDGVWRGTATRNGAGVQVWLDYEGNVGQGTRAVPAVASGTAGLLR